jgi:hypothetical protein
VPEVVPNLGTRVTGGHCWQMVAADARSFRFGAVV